ncbi:hypothetical protein I4U23_019180 [Adineta vaga]|nr:hypothetical protein I4U23_019180 [Adineta vaga]
MANRSGYLYSHDTSLSASNYDRQSSRNSLNSNASHISHLISQRQLSDSRIPTTCFLLFENILSTNNNEISFLEYRGTRSRNHHHIQLYLPQLTHQNSTSSDDIKKNFVDCIRQVLNSIPPEDLSSYVVSVRTGVLYFFSKRFRFHRQYAIETLHDLMEKKISTSDQRYYREQNNSYHSDESLRSSFCNIKPVSDTKKLAQELHEYKFHIKQQKYVFRIYLQSDDKQTHVCIVDPTANYSIVEFSKDFQRTSNIDYIRDRRSSNFQREKTYDDVFDFRIQFQYNPRTRRDQMTTIEYELRQEFPNLDSNFKNENILHPINSDTDDIFQISEQLYPYIRFIRRDFGDVYYYEGDDPLFENFTIYLESSVEYQINRNDFTCKRHLSTHGIVYARIDLNTLMSSNVIDENLLIDKLWDMGTGLTSIAGACTTSETQQSTNYYTSNGDQFTAEDEALVQTILKQSILTSMLGLPENASSGDIEHSYHRISTQLNKKWLCFQRGLAAREKLEAFYENYLKQ